MKRFKSILMAAGGKGWEESALKRAVALAIHNHARLTVIDVIEELPRELCLYSAEMDIEDLQKLVVAERMQELSRSIEPVSSKGIEVSAKLLLGTPFIEIIREVVRNRHDLVITTTNGKNGVCGKTLREHRLTSDAKVPLPCMVDKAVAPEEIRQDTGCGGPGSP